MNHALFLDTPISSRHPRSQIRIFLCDHPWKCHVCIDSPGSGDLRHFRTKHGIWILARWERVHRCSREACNKTKQCHFRLNQMENKKTPPFCAQSHKYLHLDFALCRIARFLFTTITARFVSNISFTSILTRAFHSSMIEESKPARDVNAPLPEHRINPLHLAPAINGAITRLIFH